MQFREKLDRWLKETGTPVLTLSNASGFTSGVIKRWLAGKSPEIDQLKGLVELSGYPIRYWADDEIEDPMSVVPPSELLPAERKVMEMARQLGIEETGHLMVWICGLGYDASFERLLGKQTAISASVKTPLALEGPDALVTRQGDALEGHGNHAAPDLNPGKRR